MEFQNIPITLISPSPMNPRKTFDEESLKELAENIGKQGLYQPITIRPIADIEAFVRKTGWKQAQPPHYEIVCGERRFRAFSMLDGRSSDNAFSSIPAIVRELSDEETLEAMITENLQRKDVDPMEEAVAFGLLIENGRSAEEVAARFGKSIRFVQDRIKLNSLIPELRSAVTNDRMPIVAAMMIAKLDEKYQQQFKSQYASHYDGYSKNAAEGFINGLFMKIGSSLWFKDGKINFSGGCARKCSECLKNTANHGCLFWEMKGEEGKCTDRVSFEEKTLAYILSEIDRRSHYVVRKGEPLAFGKIALVSVDYGYVPEWYKGLKTRLIDEIDKRGYEIFNPYTTFDRPVSYSNDDERTEKLLENGDAYRCLSFFGSVGAELVERVYHVKKNDVDVNSDVNGRPRRVGELTRLLKQSMDNLPLEKNSAAVKALKSCNPASSDLLDDEMTLMLAMMLFNNLSLRRHFSIATTASVKDIVGFVVDHPEERNVIIRGWMFLQIDLEHGCRKMAEPLMKDLCAINCPKEYEKSIKRIITKHDREVSKLTRELEELGYDTEGKPVVTQSDLRRAFDEMKGKHPDAVILFRRGDFYECYGEDADTVSNVIGLNVVKDGEWQKCCFPHHALDSYLPMLVRAKQRVAISEQTDLRKRK
ncbi:MAG: ParB/RepB/Spo0J family partition protein [Muribaculaceae bacterium]|nr:ParB/RepB/Spo0J family partition protein [Muribaculaceae bacterium]